MRQIRIITAAAALLCLSATCSVADMYSAAREDSAKTLCNRRAEAYEQSVRGFTNMDDCARGLSMAYHLEGEELRLVLSLVADAKAGRAPYDAKTQVRDACMKEMVGHSYY